MGIETEIAYCDSTVNPIVGCQGCELWNEALGVRDCYAGQLVTRYAGNPGWPEKFTQPIINLKRLEMALKWKSLRGIDRPGKPWLNDWPRIIFLNDLADSFQKSIPNDWAAPYIDRMEKSDHIWLWLTKNPNLMLSFFSALRRVPDNFWLGVTVTSQATMPRINQLLQFRALFPKMILWVSFEPLIGMIHDTYMDLFPQLDWAVVGGMSRGSSTTQAFLLDSTIAQLHDAGVPVFFKQYGSLESNPNKLDPTARENGGLVKGGNFYHGRQLLEMPESARQKMIDGDWSLIGGKNDRT